MFATVAPNRVFMRQDGCQDRDIDSSTYLLEMLARKIVCKHKVGKTLLPINEKHGEKDLSVVLQEGNQTDWYF